MKKLVRDKIPEIMINNGQTTRTYKATKEGYLECDTPEELVDMLEVIYAICEDKGVSLEKLEELRQKKLKERGGFEKRIILTIN